MEYNTTVVKRPEPRNTTKILYLCDRLKCENCCYPDCKHTLDITHAVNFELAYKDSDNNKYYFERGVE